MRRFLLAAVVGGLTVVGANAAQAGPPVQFVDWHHHYPVVVDRCYYPPVRYAQPAVAYYSPVITPTVVAAPPVVAAPSVVVAPPAGFVSLSGRHFGIRFGF